MNGATENKRLLSAQQRLMMTTRAHGGRDLPRGSSLGTFKGMSGQRARRDLSRVRRVGLVSLHKEDSGCPVLKLNGAAPLCRGKGLCLAGDGPE